MIHYASAMPDEPAKREDVRTTVSLHPALNQMAEELMESRGYNNFSALVADLIRQERDRVTRQASPEKTHYRLNENKPRTRARPPPKLRRPA